MDLSGLSTLDTLKSAVFARQIQRRLRPIRLYSKVSFYAPMKLKKAGNIRKSRPNQVTPNYT